jgi:hypothetical protein
MGGTTAKACVIDGGAPLVAREFEVARADRFKKGSGLPIRVPVIEMIEIGAGGGSIARVDRMGLLKVGPDSAGADPGPACYNLGGRQPTVTDADLLLGYLDAEFFLGGRMRLDRAAAERAVAEHVARRSGSTSSPRRGASTAWSTRTWRRPRGSTASSAAATCAPIRSSRSGARDPVHGWHVGGAASSALPRVLEALRRPVAAFRAGSAGGRPLAFRLRCAPRPQRLPMAADWAGVGPGSSPRWRRKAARCLRQAAACPRRDIRFPPQRPRCGYVGQGHEVAAAGCPEAPWGPQARPLITCGLRSPVYRTL